MFRFKYSYFQLWNYYWYLNNYGLCFWIKETYCTLNKDNLINIFTKAIINQAIFFFTNRTFELHFMDRYQLMYGDGTLIQ